MPDHVQVTSRKPDEVLSIGQQVIPELSKMTADARSQALETSLARPLLTAHAVNAPLTGHAEVADDPVVAHVPIAAAAHDDPHALIVELISACESARPFVLHAGSHWPHARIVSATKLLDSAIAQARAWMQART